MVVDSNYLQKDELRTYLAASTENRVVLTDFAAMEAYKGDTLRSIYRSMDILAQFPKQVIVLKNTWEASVLSGRAAVSQKSLIDRVQTDEFSGYCRELLAAQNGDVSLQLQLLKNGREATAYIDRMLLDMPKLSQGIDQIAKSYSAAELKILRNREAPTPQMRATLGV